jgi:hypothetical protein
MKENKMENQIDTGLYSDLMIAEMCDVYLNSLRKGEEPEKAIRFTIQQYVEYIVDTPNYGYRAWFALADTQWKFGLLSDPVKTNALSILISKEDLPSWKEFGPVVFDRRKKVLTNLERKLQTENQKPKKIIKIQPYKQDWNLWDVYALKIKGPCPEYEKLAGEYFLFQKIGETEYDHGNLIPVIWVKLTKNRKLPASPQEYDELDFVQISSRPYESRVLPLSGKRPFKDQIKEKLSQSFPVDEYGYLPEYRIKIKSRYKKDVPSELIFLGSYPNVLPPKNEYVHNGGQEIWIGNWGNIVRYLEKTYVLHNLRMGLIYEKDYKKSPVSGILQILLGAEKKN